MLLFFINNTATVYLSTGDKKDAADNGTVKESVVDRP